jgi:hypothetical protein
VVRLQPGERTLWDNRFKIELSGEEKEHVTVRALGEEGLRDMRDRVALLASLPRVAGRTLPSCWRGDSLISMPFLGGLSGSSNEAGLDCRATFVSAESVFTRGERPRL